MNNNKQHTMNTMKTISKLQEVNSELERLHDKIEVRENLPIDWDSSRGDEIRNELGILNEMFESYEQEYCELHEQLGIKVTEWTDPREDVDLEDSYDPAGKERIRREMEEEMREFNAHLGRC